MVLHFLYKVSSFLINDVLHLGFFLKTAFFTFAIILLIFKLLNLIIHSKKFLYPLLSLKTDLSAKYGKNSWALVTGASDGIGKSFAFELAKAGFNIILLGRNHEKVTAVEKDLKSKYSSIETKIIIEDLKNASDGQFTERILNQVKGLDVSFLVNNAGMAKVMKYTEIPISDIKDLINVNAIAPSLLTRAFLPTLSQRKRSALITVSSISADEPRHKSQLYGASKALVDYLSRGLQDEHKNIDFLSLKPAYVSTNMTDHKEVGMYVVAPEQCVKSTLRALGHTEATYGNWRHSIQAVIYHSLPEFVRRLI